MLRVYGHHHIPDNAVIEILLRLSVKSLLRFRCVCKTWKALIRNSNFITKQLNYHINNARLLIQHCNFENFSFSLFLDETLTKPPLLSDDLGVQHMHPDYSGVFGPFNGILGLYTWYHIALWNPAMREFRFLSVPDTNLPSNYSPHLYYFAFGLDLTTNDCKVVWIQYIWDDENDIPYNPKVISVYTLATDSWRVFEVDLSINGFIQDSLCNTYMNGFYYWFVYGDNDDFEILSFDMGNDVFRKITVQHDISKLYHARLSMYNNSIAIVLFDANAVEKHFDIWLMKEEECWTKQLTIGPVLDVGRNLLGFWENGELFLEATNNDELVLYNPNTAETKDLSHRVSNCQKVLIYKESLVSVKEGNGF